MTSSIGLHKLANKFLSITQKPLIVKRPNFVRWCIFEQRIFLDNFEAQKGRSHQ